jgi:hypothetical protein
VQAKKNDIKHIRSGTISGRISFGQTFGETESVAQAQR